MGPDERCRNKRPEEPMNRMMPLLKRVPQEARLAPPWTGKGAARNRYMDDVLQLPVPPLKVRMPSGVGRCGRQL